MEWQAQLWGVASVAYAMALGGLVGVERELKDRPAGFRTHMLVAGAAALLVSVGQLVLADGRYGGAHERIQVDPLRLVEAVVAGVAFIGAGTIFATRAGRTVAGITTAASLLMVAVIGVAAGFRYNMLAFLTTLLTLLTLTALRMVEARLSPGKRPDRTDPADQNGPR